MSRIPRLRFVSLLLLLAAPIVASCSSDSTGPPPVGAIVPQGGSISAEAGSFVTVRVRVDDEQDNPIEGIEVNFSPVGGAGSVNPATVTTGTDGTAQTSWTLGATAGAQSLRVTAGQQSLTLSATVSAGPPASLEIVSGDGQTGTVGQALAAAVTVRVVDRFDNPASGTTVSFSSTTTGASTSPASTPANADGRASTTWTLGEDAGSQTLQARAGAAGSVTFTATAQAGAPAQVVIVSGNAQEAQVGETLPQPLVAAVQDQFGNEIPDAALQFAPAEGSGSVNPTSAQTDADGRAQTVWTLGSSAGTQTVAARHADLEPAEFTAEATAGPPAVLVKVSGDNQTGFANFTLSQSVVVRVEDEFGNGVSGVSVGFDAGNGSVSPGVGQTDSDGLRSATWTLGDQLGEQTLEASAEGLDPVTFTATATEFNGVVEIVRGDDQTTAAGTPVPIPPRVRVVDGNDNPVIGAAVTFQVASGGGSVQGGVRTTDGNGLATVDEWILGGAAGENTLSVGGTGLTGATFTATGEAVSETFDIEVRFVGDPPDVYAQAFLDAEAKWERIMVEGLADVQVNVNAGTCGIPHPAVNETIDDIVLFVQLDSIDGPGNILGQAGPCIVRNAGTLPLIGRMQFDTADLATFNDAGQLDEIAVHEMAHAMGFIYTIWSELGLNADVGGPDSRFLGAGAIARFEAAGGQPQGAVPLETNFGAGSDDSHWDEDLFDSELMTPAINDGANPLSAITIAAMWDMGYSVDIGEADAYMLPGAAAVAGGGARGLLLKEMAPGPLLDPQGRPYRGSAFNRSPRRGSGPPARPGPGGPGGPR